MENPLEQEIAQSRLFAGAGPETLRQLLDWCVVAEIAAGQVLIARGQPNDCIYLLLSGQLDVHLGGLKEPSFVRMAPGDCVGEMSIIESRETSAFVVAGSDCRLLAIPQDLMWSLIHSSHAVARNMLHTLSARLRQGNEAVNNSMHLQLKFENMAFVDGLTGLHNRRWLNQAFRRQLERAQCDGKPLALLMVDIDHFKQYNDSHGHLAGDKALNAVAATLNDRLRPGDLLARFGGEEFAVMLPDTGGGDAQMIAERLRLAVEEAHGAHGVHPVSVSIGLAQLAEGDALEQVLERADAAMYRAKAEGRNCVRTG